MARNRTACHRPTPRPVSAPRCTHYLKAIQAPGSDDADEVVAELREMKINDFMTKDGQLREHARVMRDMYLEEVKSAA